jgi:DNA-binding GntR family transcriptional regulator
LSPREVRELFRVRAALEGLAAAEVIASKGRTEAVARLREALTQLDANGDFATMLDADLGFHLLLCRLSGNSMLVDTWRHLEGRTRVMIMSGESANTPSMMVRDRHAPIVDAIETGDAAAAMAVVQEHMAAAAAQYAPADATG